ncbi:MAG TPA: hypothetical protein VE990_12125 [Acidimicrobiales bacterium]|nr:hypothetical protein [Acidimicrobiales bacterium]
MQLGLLAVLAVLLGAGILAGHLHHQASPRPAASLSGAPRTIHGSVTSDSSPGCAAGPHGVTVAAPVTVLDPAGKVVGSVTLSAGVESGTGCSWAFAVTVPDEPAYSVQVADLPPTQITRQELGRTDGTVRIDDPS